MNNAHTNLDADDNACILAQCNVKGNLTNSEMHVMTKHGGDNDVIKYINVKEGRGKLKFTGAVSFSGCVGSVIVKSRVQSLMEKIVNWTIACHLSHKICH